MILFLPSVHSGNWYFKETTSVVLIQQSVLQQSFLSYVNLRLQKDRYDFKKWNKKKGVMYTNIIQTMSWLPCFNENLLFFLNYLKQFKQTNKIEPGHFFYKNKVLCIQYETGLKLQASITFSHLDIYTSYSIYTQMKYCKYSSQSCLIWALECVRLIPVRALTNGFES